LNDRNDHSPWGSYRVVDALNNINTREAKKALDGYPARLN